MFRRHRKRTAQWRPRQPALAAIVLALVWTSAASGQMVERNGVILVDAVVAAVDGEPITLVDLERFERGPARLLARAEQASRRSILEAMVKMKLFEKEFERHGIRAADSDVEIYIDNLLEQSGSSREAVRRILEELGLTWDVYFERMRHEVQRLALIDREIRARVSVTPEEVERYWKNDPSYMRSPTVEIAHIYIPIQGASEQAREAAKARAEEAYQAAVRNFAKAARAYSEGPNAEEGGVLGRFERGTMAPMFEEALAGLSEGEVSRPFEAGGAWHIVKLVREYEAERVPLEDVRAEIEEKLYNENLDARFQRWVEEDLRKRHHVVVMLDELESLLAEETA